MLRRSIKAIAVSAALALILTNAGADDIKAGTLEISTPWARATPKGATIGGGYFTVRNNGTTADRLTGGSTTISSRLELHEMSMSGSVMKMRQLSGGLEIKPGETVELRPGGAHVMFVGLKRQLQKDDRFKATLQFEKAGTVEVDFGVAGIGATSAAGEATPANMPAMSHDHMGGMKKK